MKHDTRLTASAKAILAAGQHLQRKDAGDPFELLAKKLGEHTDVVLERISKTDKELKSLREEVDEVDKRMSRPGFGGHETKATSWGEQFVSDEGLKSFAADESRPGRFRVNIKTTMTNATDSGGSLHVPTRDTTVMMPKRRMTVRDLLPTISVSSDSVEYAQQTARTSAAATVAEGALKPESAYAFELQSTQTRVIAHWIPASRQVLSDAGQLRDLIDTELRYGLMQEEEAQLLSGDGTGTNLSGLIPNATAYADPLTLADANMIDTVGTAILQSALADFPADGILVHPSDWMRMRLLKDADGKYILGDPQTNVTPGLFGLPVVPTQAIAVDTFLVGNFRAAATLYDRWAARVEVSTEHADYFTRNLVAILAEERLGLAVKQPAALIHGDFGNVA